MKTTSLLSIALVPLAACAAEEPKTMNDGARLELAVAALELPGVDEAIYRLEVYNADDELVWDKGGLRSTRYGDGLGALTYVGTCDASSSPASVKLVLESLWADGVELVDGVDYQNPARTPGGLVRRDIPCVPNTDTRVDFDLTILRSAGQGFFDIGVTFQDVFCSAKLDCVEDLLSYPAGHPDGPGRGPTAVVAFACTAGTDDEDTYLYLNPARIVCGVAPNEVSYTLYPDGEPGNQGPLPPVAWQTAIYTGQEAFQDVDKCYWNFAFGLDLQAIAAEGPCRIELTGTASGTPFEGGQSPTGVYPYVSWSVPIEIGPDGLECGANPLNGAGSGVQTAYTDFSGEFFAYQLECDSGTVTTPGGFKCASTIDDQEISVAMVNATEFVAQIGATVSPAYALPAGLSLARPRGGAAGCCVDPCCEDDE